MRGLRRFGVRHHPQLDRRHAGWRTEDCSEIRGFRTDLDDRDAFPALLGETGQLERLERFRWSVFRVYQCQNFGLDDAGCKSDSDSESQCSEKERSQSHIIL